MFFSALRGHIRQSLFILQTQDAQKMARLTGYLGALR